MSRMRAQEAPSYPPNRAANTQYAERVHALMRAAGKRLYDKLPILPIKDVRGRRHPLVACHH